MELNNLTLICDSGSTKTHWHLTDGVKIIHQSQSAGLNPYFVSQSDIAHEIAKALDKITIQNTRSIHFYGAGCASPEKANFIKEGLYQKFPHSKIQVYSDLLGSARALHGTSAGLVVILGTGAAMAFYDGEKIVKTAPSLGYILGDEGSGAYFGKKLIAAYLTKELPASLNSKFEKFTTLRKNEILENIYHKPFANKFLASFMPFISINYDNEFVVNLISETIPIILKQMKRHFEPNELQSLGFTGSVAYCLQNHLTLLANQIHQNQIRILKDPIQSLSIFHIQNKIL